MVDRAAGVFRDATPRRDELRALVTALRSVYSNAPAHRPGELSRVISRFIVEAELKTLATAPGGVAWMFSPVAMGESRWPIPPVASIDELAAGFGVTVLQLRWLADERGAERTVTDERLRNYVYRWVPKRGDRWRLIEAPKDRLKRIQRVLLLDVLGPVPVHHAAMGFVRGKSVIDAASAHVGREVVIRIDLADFFTTVTRAQVAAIFRTIGYPEPIARLFAALSTNQAPSFISGDHRLDATARARLRTPHLPQGAPTSPMLANLAAYRLDCRLSGVARAFALSYTRYADDLVFSGDRLSTTRISSLLGLAQAVIEDEGFTVNHRKTNIMASSTRQRVTGIIVNDRLNVARTERDRLRATLHNCVRSGPDSQNLDGVADFRSHLLGRVSWIRSCNTEAGDRLLESFALIDWRARASR